ncbi:MAG: phosphoribosylformimino-5-aminoimidazole carboxamide ribotide isomerase [Acetatifactor sp.]|nr:phosphoribosylformimino-5-aminoimidazole carboxamide ribotide isomerase [Acetatifactor sp.]
MEFRPCIDIHNGKVKQIVGSSLKDAGNTAKDNFVAEHDGAYYGKLYRDKGLKGGHIILLNSKGSEYYEATKKQAMSALKAYPKGLQIGGGINAGNALSFIEAGASHVIVTSYVFSGGEIHYDRLEELVKAVGKERLVLDLSCRKYGEEYFVVTDRWQNKTSEVLNGELLKKLSDYCDEFLIHAVDVEGKNSGIDPIVLGICTLSPIPITYAGGIHSYDDIDIIKTVGDGRVNFTVGSSLDIFGGNLSFEKLCEIN